MSNSPVLSSLVNKYAELVGELDEARKQTRRLEHNVFALEEGKKCWFIVFHYKSSNMINYHQ